jgi:hypothetical protein
VNSSFAQSILEHTDEMAVKILESEIQGLSNGGDSSSIVQNNLKSKVPEKELKVEVDTFFDPNFDYSEFSGRMTDRDDTASIIKVSSESRNVKFFRASDPVEFRLPTGNKKETCEAFVRSVEKNFFVLYVKDIAQCFSKSDYFRRGTSLVFKSKKLYERVKEASLFRSTLFEKKKDFLSQLNGINKKIWNYEDEKIKIASEYDKKILALEKEKQDALEIHMSKKNDYIVLQRELIYRLDTVDKEMNFYRVEKDEALVDRWHLDKDLGYPVVERPETLRKRE